MLRRLFGVFALLVILGNVQVAFGHGVLQGDQCTIGATERISGNVYALCRLLTVSGVVDGNLFGGGASIVIDGTVTGSVYLAGAQLDVSGTIGDDLHFGGGVLNILPSAQFLDANGDLISVNLSTQVDNGGIPGSITSASYQLVLNGAVNREVSFWGSALVINNTVGGDVTATVGDPASSGVAELGTLLSFLPYQIDLVNPGLQINDGGMVNGQLRYAGPVVGAIAVELPNPPEFTAVAAQSTLLAPERSLLESLRDFASQAIRELVVLAGLGLAGLLLTPRAVQDPIYALRVRPLPSLGVGLLTFIISFPIFFIVIPLFGALFTLLLVVLQLSDLALIAAGIIALLLGGGAGLFYYAAIFASRVIVAVALGRVLVRLLRRNSPDGQRASARTVYICLLVGVVVLALTASLPYIGFFVNAVAAFLGLGAILNTIQRQLRIAREANAPMPDAMNGQEMPPLPPPIIEDKPMGPGMDNLPSGFHWWK